MSISFEKVNFVYDENTPFQYAALKDVDLDISMNKVTAIIGNTGSGKSTLVQHLNALLKPTSGKIRILDRVIDSEQKLSHVKSLRKEVGLVFQFPEYQLFEETILKDVSYGPKNFESDEEKIMQSAKKALDLVGIGPEYYDRSPLELSGGQKRRIAIAGILAMDPSVLVLDEPTAGLDPQGAKQMMSLFETLNKKYNKTVLVVTHDMEHVLNYCDEVIVMKDGQVKNKSDVLSFFNNEELLKELHIELPNIIKIRKMLKEHGISIDDKVVTIPELAKALKEVQNG